MSNELSVEGMSIAPGVVETIISIAANEVDDDGRLRITIHVEVYYGYVLPEVAANLRQSVADALLVQVGLEAAAVDIFVDGLQFAA